jgi:crotonobetaine/carnitine-CoA ligase
MSQPPSPDDRHHPLKSVQMAPLIGELDEFRERFGVPVYTVYNMTELSTPIVSPGTNLVDGTSCGQMREGYDCRVFDAHDREVPHGEVGELVVRAREPFALMAGYWRRPQATAECFRNLWLHTGDLFRRDEAGNFYYCDRLKDAIRYRGQNVSSSELEREVNSHPAIVESAVIGVPSEVNDEDIKVVVQLAVGATLDPEELIAFLAERVPRFMLPRYVEVVAELPRSSSEKIQKGDLRKDALNARTWDRTVLASRV